MINKFWFFLYRWLGGSELWRRICPHNWGGVEFSSWGFQCCLCRQLIKYDPDSWRGMRLAYPGEEPPPLPRITSWMPWM